MRPEVKKAAALATMAAVLLCGLLVKPGRPRPAPGTVASQEKHESPLSTTSPGSALHAYHFTRSVHVAMSEQELIQLELEGALWIQGNPAAPTAFIVKMNSARTPQGSIDKLPAIRLERTGGDFQISSEAAASETIQAAARFARDLVDQYLFFAHSDMQGHYEARITTPAPGHFRKLKTRYLDLPYADAQMLDSRHALWLAADEAPTKIEGREKIITGKDAMAVRSETAYRIESTPALPDTVALARITWASAGIEVASNQTQIKPKRGVPPAPGGISTVPTLEELLAALRSGTLKSGHERLAWYRNLVRRLNAEPGPLEPVRQALAEVRSNPDAFQLLVGAAASSSNAEAGRTLLETYQNNEYSPEERAQIMTAWTSADVGFSTPTAAFLVKLASDANTTPAQAQNAMLALGAQLLKADQASTESRRDIENLLLAKLNQSQTEAATIAALDAIGNSGGAVFLSAIQIYLSHTSEQVRAHAYLALRLIPGGDVLVLLRAGSTDPSGDVQSSVQLALNIRG